MGAVSAPPVPARRLTLMLTMSASRAAMERTRRPPPPGRPAFHKDPLGRAGARCRSACESNEQRTARRENRSCRRAGRSRRTRSRSNRLPVRARHDNGCALRVRSPQAHRPHRQERERRAARDRDPTSLRPSTSRRTLRYTTRRSARSPDPVRACLPTRPAPVQRLPGDAFRRKSRTAPARWRRQKAP